MKKTRTRTIPFIVTIFIVIAISAMQVAPALADDAAPPPPEPTEVAPPEEESAPEAPPLEPAEAPVTDVEEVPPTAEPVVPEEQVVPMVETQAEASVAQPETPAEVLAQVPEGTELIVLDESGEALSLVSEEAVETFYSGDPQWCPVGVIPGAPSCSGNLSAFNDPDGAGPQTGLIQWLVAHQPSVAGVIWVAYGYDSSNEGGAPIMLTGDPMQPGTLLSSMANYALTIKGGWNGLTGSTVITTTPSTFNVPLSITGWNGNVTLNDIVITSTTSGDALTITTTKDITLTRVNSHNNTGSGANLSNHNNGGTGKVTITSSNFSQNGGTYALSVTSNGVITLNSVTVNENNSTDYGALLNNTSGPLKPGVTLNGCTFNDNVHSGLSVNSMGLISANDLTASGNGNLVIYGGGATLHNNSAGATAGVTLTGTNIFSDNYGTGLMITSNGAIKLNNVIANANNGTSYNVRLDNSGSSTSQGITLTGTNQFLSNYSTGLIVLSKGLVSLNNVNASGNLHGTGVDIDNCRWDAGLSACKGSALGGVKLTGTNVFNDNFGSGLVISSAGAITLSNVTANRNGLTNPSGGSGASLQNGSATTPKAVTLTGINTFNGNYTNGLVVLSRGTIAVSSLTAGDNTHGIGAQLNNAISGGVGGITLSGANLLTGNSGIGLDAFSYGAITISAVKALDNGGVGVHLVNSGTTPKPVTISGASEFSHNGNIGLSINSAGVIKLNSLTANNNGVNGADLRTTYDSASIAALTLGGTNTFNNNNDTGLHITVNGILTLNNVNASWNSGLGADIRNTAGGPAAARKISLTGSNTFNDNYHEGLLVNSHGAITLSNVTATSNGWGAASGTGVVLNNSAASLPGAVTLTGTNNFSSNYQNGLTIYSLGAIAVNNLTASDNGSLSSGIGASLNNNYAGAVGGVTLSGTNTFDRNYHGGLVVESFKAIKINNLRANNNGHAATEYGAHLYNADGINMSVTLTGSVIANQNSDTGLYVESAGLITAASITAKENSQGHGVNLNNTFGTSTAGVTLTGINEFSSNTLYGLLVTSWGAINLLTTSLTANNNGAYGADLENQFAGTPQAIKLAGTNVFNGNSSGGLYVRSKGAITINNLTASGNPIGQGASISNNVSDAVGGVTLTGNNRFEGNFGTGLYIVSMGAITINNVIANNNGQSGSGSGAYLYNRDAGTPQFVKLTGTNTFNGNYSGGLYIDSRGAITANNLTASYNTSGEGAYLVNSSLGAVGGVTLTGNNTFNNNYNTGLEINSLGAVTINNLTANRNGLPAAGSGAYIFNGSAGTPQFVKLTGTNTFNGNRNDGLVINSLGAVTVNNLTASNSVLGSGVSINNVNPAAKPGITLTGFASAVENGSSGIYMVSSGNVSLTRITADGNNVDGLYVSTSGNITLTCGSFTRDTQEGVQLLAPLATLTGVFAAGNGTNYNLAGVTTPIIVRNCPLP